MKKGIGKLMFDILNRKIPSKGLTILLLFTANIPGLETAFRELKYAVGMVNFHCKKAEFVIQEVWTNYNFKYEFFCGII